MPRCLIAVVLLFYLARYQGSKLYPHQEAGSDFKGLEDEVLSLARLGDTPAVVPMAASIRTLIEKTLLPDINAAHANAQKEMQGLKDGLAFCLGGGISKTVDHSLEHKQCRKKEEEVKADSDSLCSAADAFAALMLTNCTIFDELANVVPMEIPEPCEKATGADLSNELHFEKVAEYFTEKVQRWEEANSSCRLSRARSRDANKTCREGLESYNAQVVKCDTMQRAMDDYACEMWTLGRCGQHDACWANARQAYAEGNASVAKGVEHRKIQHTTLKRIECFLGVFEASATGANGNTTDALHLCGRKIYDSSHLDIFFPYYEDREPMLPHKPPCPADGARPGTTEYESLEYSVLPAGAPAAPCACSCCISCSTFLCRSGSRLRALASSIQGASQEVCCEACGDDCEECLEDSCMKCVSMKFLFQGNCVSNCPDGYVHHSGVDGGFCQPIVTLLQLSSEE